MNYDTKEIGKRIRLCRSEYQKGKKKGEKNQESFGFDLKDDGNTGYDRKTINKWENGKTLPPLDVLLKMCKLFDCELGYLLCEPEYANKTKVVTDITNETGLSEEAIKLLRDKKEYDEMREIDYHRRQELKADCPSDVIFLGGEKPIKTAEVISAIIESDHLDGIIRTIERMVDDQAEIFMALDDKADDDKQAELLRRKESAMQKNDYTAFLVTTYIRNILLDFITKKAEEKKNDK